MSRITGSVDDLGEECCELLHERIAMSLFSRRASVVMAGQVFLTDPSNPGQDTQDPGTIDYDTGILKLASALTLPSE